MGCAAVVALARDEAGVLGEERKDLGVQPGTAVGVISGDSEDVTQALRETVLKGGVGDGGRPGAGRCLGAPGAMSTATVAFLSSTDGTRREQGRQT